MAIICLYVAMQIGAPRLAIDYGTACTRAVVVVPGQSWQPLMIDGSAEPSSAAHVDAHGQITVGSAAWRLAAVDPDGFVGAPLAEGAGTVSRHGREVEVCDLVTATLLLVSAEAIRLLGAVPADVRMTVPAGWGPRRRTWLRRAAHQAGLGLPQLVEAPVAAAGQRLLDGAQLQVGAFVLVCDVGATTEATVLRRGPRGFEVLSTLHAADAGGQAIDGLLAQALVAAVPVPDGTPSWPVLASMRAGKEAVSVQPAVTVPLPEPQPAVILNAAMVESAALPVLHRVADLASAAVVAAELTPADLAAIYVVGAAAAMPAVGPTLEQRLGVPVQVVPMPAATALLGAVEAAGTLDGSADTVQQEPLPPLRRVLGLLLPGVLSLALFAHTLYSAVFSGSRLLHERPWWVMAHWGELATGCVLALVVGVSAGPWFGAALARDQRLHDRWNANGQLAAGLLTGVALGGIVAALYGASAALYFLYPFGIPLRWTLLPILPAAVLVIAVAWQIRHRRDRPPGGWEAFLAIPLAPVLMMGAGMLVASQLRFLAYPAWMGVYIHLGSRTGIALVGVGIAVLLARVAVLRLIGAIALGTAGFLLSDWRLDNGVGVAVAVAVAGWWAQRLWALLR
ncbi:hypothetical protein Apa02nite_091360 [Actinoplanes palleronii]|uniref:Hsp70 protein n=2 Tax=Actinoplanes palleronii TaxID=113570 RepID=A0ABQ4BQT9_9ACTN|nr:hypothetical protein Apa02nite_091360 [Actinoplanes palleronii]